ncbi:hypothetical protein D9M69_265750 [compost metagenome]
MGRSGPPSSLFRTLPCTLSSPSAMPWASSRATGTPFTGTASGSGMSGMPTSGCGNSTPKEIGPVGKPISGSTRPAVSPSSTKEWPPPALPPPAPPPGPAAVASATWLGSTPAWMAACSFSTSVRSCWLGAAGISSVPDRPASGAPASSALLSGMLLSRPSTSSCPLESLTATAPWAPVTSCSPANTRSPSVSGRREPSAATANTSPTTCRTTPIDPAMIPSSRTACCQSGSADPSQRGPRHVRTALRVREEAFGGEERRQKNMKSIKRHPLRRRTTTPISPRPCVS